MEVNHSVSASASTIRSLHPNLAEILTQSTARSTGSVSQPSSPRSSTLPSPPDSPSTDSVSSFPSVSSSFFFSSVGASPPHILDARDSTQGLIIPSLTLPSALRRPTPFGQTLGDLRLIVLGSKGAGKTFVNGVLLEDNEDVVDAGTWEETEHGNVLHASTDWIEHRDAHGLEKYESSRNVEIIELLGYDANDNPRHIIQTLTSIIHAPFYSVSEVLDPKRQPSPTLKNLVSSPSAPLHTALIFLLPSTPSDEDHLIIDTIGPYIPIIVLPRLSDRHRYPSASKLSQFRPNSPLSLRTGLFRTPDILSSLRAEAADRFLRWREVERVVDDIQMSRRKEAHDHDHDNYSWNKAEWESSLSHDVAKRLRDDGPSREQEYRQHYSGVGLTGPCVPFDPLHIPSLVVFSLSLFTPLRSKIERSTMAFAQALGEYHVRLALFGGFCVGIGIGLFLRG